VHLKFYGVLMATTIDELADVRSLMARATGDEKHDESSSSTLDALWVLYDRVLRIDAGAPGAEDRDRFILSKGHGPMAFYAVLARRGFLPRDELPRFLTRLGRLGGHPDRLQVPGVEASTGSLGHGLPMAVGVAYALRAKGLGEQRVFVLTGDAELNEGSNWEAILHAGAVGLDNLTLVVVDNRSGSLPMGSIEAKLAAFGWDTVTVDGRNHGEIEAALRPQAAGRPTAVVAAV
jgi:transketolase